MVPAIPTQPSPIAQPSANMRSVGIPITAAACRSCAVAWRPKPVSVRVTNHQSAAKDNRQMPPEINWGWPMKIGPICTRPAMNGLVMVRKSGVQRNWAPARSATPRPNVPQTWASMGAFNNRRMMPKCANMPATASRIATSGSDSIGSRPPRAQNQNAVNMASMRNSPCAKLTISIRPKIRVRPTATSA